MSHSLRVSRAYLAVAIDRALWRGLAIARAQQARSPIVASLLRRGVLLLWWTAALQLHIPAREGLRARRLRRNAPAAPGLAVTKPVEPATLVLPLAEAPVV